LVIPILAKEVNLTAIIAQGFPMLLPGRLRRLLRGKREEAGHDGVAASFLSLHPGEARSAEETAFTGKRKSTEQ
jgi:hypothetical protein